MFIVFLPILVVFIYFSFKAYKEEKFLIKVIKFKNNIQGIKTEITPQTLKWMKLFALWATIVSLCMIGMLLIPAVGFFI